MGRWLNCVDPVTASGDLTGPPDAMLESIDGAVPYEGKRGRNVSLVSRVAAIAYCANALSRGTVTLRPGVP